MRNHYALHFIPATGKLILHPGTDEETTVTLTPQERATMQYILTEIEEMNLSDKTMAERLKEKGII